MAKGGYSSEIREEMISHDDAFASRKTTDSGIPWLLSDLLSQSPFVSIFATDLPDLFNHAT